MPSERQFLVASEQTMWSPKVVAGLAAVASFAATFALVSSPASSLYVAPVAPAVAQSSTVAAPVYQTQAAFQSRGVASNVAQAAARESVEQVEMQYSQPSQSWAGLAGLAAIPVAVAAAVAAFRSGSKQSVLAPIDVVLTEDRWSMLPVTGETTIAKNYAEALIELGQEGNCLEQIHTDMENFGSILEDESFADFFTNPIMDSDKRIDVIGKMCDDANMHPTTKQFVQFLVDKKRIRFLKSIIEEFDRIFYDVTGTQVATVTAASVLSEDQLRMIANKLHKMTKGRNVKIKSEVDASLLAGFILEYGKSGSQRVDLSLRGQLQGLEEGLKDSVRKLISQGVPVGIQLMVAALGVNALVAGDADAAPGKLFDFNATLPIQMVQFLLLMVFLEKTVFTPVGKVLDDRARQLKAKTQQSSSNTKEIDELTAKAEELLAAARRDAGQALEQAKKDANATGAAKLAAAKAENERSIKMSMEEISKAKAELWARLEKEVVPVLADDIIAKTVPEMATAAK